MTVMEYGIGFLLSLVFSLGLGPVVIPRLRQLKFGQSIREEGPQGHMKKQGTPTIGALIFITAILVVIALMQVFSYEILYMMTAFLLLGALGFIDDYIKVVLKRNLGLESKQKLLGQLLIGIILAYMAKEFGTKVAIPFTDLSWDMGIIYYPFIVFFVLAISNAVNLTDGLDGLSSSVTVVVALFFAFAANRLAYDHVMFVAILLVGALLGFLRVNWHPAKVFMGDTGSMALGGLVGAFAIVMGLQFYIPLVGFIYFVETLSVIIQVAYYKRTKKRVFRMAPIHHHYELGGWSEIKIVFVFSGITAALSIISYLGLM